jgi:release factor glutamine methyltransferase
MRSFELRARVRGVDLRLRIHPEQLFVPNLMSWLAALAMEVRRGELFCDVGTGSGLHAILAAKLGARQALGTDISPVALRYARENARLNGVGARCRFLRGSLTEPLERLGLKADAMVYNAPHFPGRLVEAGLHERLRRSVNGGPGGGDLNARFVARAGRSLAEGGRIYHPVVGWSEPAKTLAAVRAGGWRSRVAVRGRVPAWGRGNNTRAWLLERPGRHVFRYDAPAGRDGAARILVLSRERLPGAERPAGRVAVDFRP